MKISVIIPTYNRATLLPRAIESVIKQTFENIEIFIIDDGSTDDTKKVVEGFSDERIHYIAHKKNKGQAAARNTGIAKATGDFIAFLDSDDTWMNTKLEEQVSLFQQSDIENLGIVYTNTLNVNQITDRQLNKKPNQRGNIIEYFLSGNSINGGSTALVKREVFFQVGLFDDSLRYGEDIDFFIRVSEKFSFDFVPKVLAVRYFHNHETRNISEAGNKIDIAQSRIFLLEKFSHHYEKYPKAKSQLLRKISTYQLLAGSKGQAMEYIWQSLKISPLNIRGYINLLAMLLGKKIFKKILALKSNK